MLSSYKMICAMLVAVLLLAGCAAAPVQPAPLEKTPLATRQPAPPETLPTQTYMTETPALKPPLVEKPMNDSTPIPIPEDPARNTLVIDARADLAKRLALPVDQIELLELSTVTWPDGSLGCPKPGMMYTQALVNGMLIRFRAGGKVYEYHSGGSRRASYCEKPGRSLPPQDR